MQEKAGIAEYEEARSLVDRAIEAGDKGSNAKSRHRCQLIVVKSRLIPVDYSDPSNVLQKILRQAM